MLDLPFSSVLPKLLLGVLILASCRKATSPPAPQTPPSPLRLECRMTGDAPAALRFELSNPGERPVYVLKWNTPLEDPAFGTILTVTRDGTEIPYGGPMAKRSDPVREDYAEIPAGGTVSATVDLTHAYDLSAPGTYEVRVTEGPMDATTEASEVPRRRDGHRAVPLRCGPVSLQPASPRP